MQGFNMGRYRPPTSDPRTQPFNSHSGVHPLGKRASKLPSQGLLVVRFELPFNIWCDACSAHIAQGTRYNADKKKVGMYHSTPIWSFACKCRNCSGAFVVQTDPKNARYIITEGATKKEEDWQRDEGEVDNQNSMAGLTVDVAGAAERKGLRDAVHSIQTHQTIDRNGTPLDAFTALERRTSATSKEEQRTQRILELEVLADSRSKDPYTLNSRLRGSFRAEKKVQEKKSRQEKKMKLQMGWSEDRKLLLCGEEDRGEIEEEMERRQWRDARQERQRDRLERAARSGQRDPPTPRSTPTTMRSSRRHSPADSSQPLSLATRDSKIRSSIAAGSAKRSLTTAASLPTSTESSKLNPMALQLARRVLDRTRRAADPFGR